MKFGKLRLLFPALILLRAASAALDREFGSAADAWLAGAVVFACAAVLAPTGARRLAQNRWVYRLYRTRRDARFGEKFYLPHRPGLLERLYLRMTPPRWCRRSKDELMLIYRDQHKLFGEGTLALAALVQANVRLFEKGFDNHPANIIYTTDFDIERPVPRLLRVAHRIFSLKNTKPEDPDEKRFASIVSYELGRDFRVTVPESLSDGLDITMTTIMVHRKHLPEGKLSAPYFPVLVHMESRAVVLLPSRYWPAGFVEEWTGFGKQS